MNKQLLLRHVFPGRYVSEKEMDFVVNSFDDIFETMINPDTNLLELMYSDEMDSGIYPYRLNCKQIASKLHNLKTGKFGVTPRTAVLRWRKALKNVAEKLNKYWNNSFSSSVIIDTDWGPSFIPAITHPESDNLHNIKLLTQNDFDQNLNYKKALLGFFNSSHNTWLISPMNVDNLYVGVISGKICFICVVTYTGIEQKTFIKLFGFNTISDKQSFKDHIEAYFTYGRLDHYAIKIK